MSHVRNVCSCGTVINQCRCAGPHPTRIIPNGCGRCCQPRESPADLKPIRIRTCNSCGRSRSTHLTLVEAFERFGYAKATCATCLLTDRDRGPSS